ncbi:hypothetical protein ACFW9X_07635, partial [Streptomyces sp. NPDC059466]
PGPRPGAATLPRTGPDAGQPADPEDESAGRRLSAGLRLLHGADLRDAVRDFPGDLLHVYGERSLLVQRKHLATGPGPRHHLTGVPQAGMRPHADRPALTRDTIARFLKAEHS